MPRFRSHVSAAALALVCLVASASVGSASSNTILVPNGWPKRIDIPRLHVHALVESLSFRRAADIKAPYRWNDVAWYDLGPRPGDPGRAAIFGHLDSTCCPAVFWNLASVSPGDLVQIAYPSGRMLTFRIMWKHGYANDQLPVKWMFSRTGERGLVLVTCAGLFHRDGTGYDHKLAVYARLVLPGGKLG